MVRIKVWTIARRIVVDLNETILLMGKSDEVIEAHGGWLGAFAASIQGSRNGPR